MTQRGSPGLFVKLLFLLVLIGPLALALALGMSLTWQTNPWFVALMVLIGHGSGMWLGLCIAALNQISRERKAQPA